MNADSPMDLRVMVDNLKNQIQSDLVDLGAEHANGKAMPICRVTEDLTAN